MSIASRTLRVKRPAVMVHSSEPLLTHPVSQACTQAQMAEPAYRYWCSRIHEVPKSHRKQWEFCYILQSVAREGMLAPGLRGLGFGVGGEPLTALFAAHGITVTATDLEHDRAHEQGWVDTDQHAQGKHTLNDRGICDPDVFERLVSFRHTDMNAIDPDLRDFDFCWSACALEHLGSIDLGLRFIANSLDTLRPGGLAVHTTEFNCNSDSDTLDNASTVLFRRRDFTGFAKTMADAGHTLAFNFDLGDQPLDQHIDVAPYSADKHLKLLIAGYTTTSFGIIIRKGIS